jgi:hypothetical protein
MMMWACVGAASRRTRTYSGWSLLGLLVCTALATTASAFPLDDEANSRTESGVSTFEKALPKALIENKYEVWAGAQSDRSVWSAYSGVTWSPFGDILDDGWRLRLLSGVGGYTIGNAGREAKGRVLFTEAYVGYQHRVGPLTAKFFAGGTFLADRLDANEDVAFVVSEPVGAKALAEFWLNLPNRGSTSLNLSYATVRDTATGHWRLGWGVLPGVALGVEAGLRASLKPQTLTDLSGAIGETQPLTLKYGAFTRIHLFGTELDLAGGMADTRDRIPGSGRSKRGPYASINWLMRF